MKKLGPPYAKWCHPRTFHMWMFRLRFQSEPILSPMSTFPVWPHLSAGRVLYRRSLGNFQLHYFVAEPNTNTHLSRQVWPTKDTLAKSLA